ncbi:MAG: M3 family metallopeptidase, partial [Myxococcota bacterium]
TLDAQSKRWLSKTLQKYRRAGVDEDEKTRERLTTLQREIAETEQTFQRNIREDVRTIELRSTKKLAGLPQDYIESHQPDDQGIIRITTDSPDYLPIMSYAQDTDLRRRLYIEFQSRGYPKNQAVLMQLLRKRHELAKLLGYSSYAEYAIEPHMIGGRQQAKEFIQQIAELARDPSQREYDQVLAYRRKHEPDAKSLEAYEYGFWSKKFKTDQFDVDPQEVRPYFPFNQVKQGLFDLTSKMFGLRYERVQNAPVWHESVETYDVYSNQGTKRLARMHLDLHPRKDKYQHACHRPMIRGVMGKQLSESALVCNFPQPTQDNPALMELKQVITFFHEFGHLVHEILSAKQEWVDFSGSESCQWDFIEAPSQMLEEWVMQPEVLQQFARHHQTQEPISLDLIERLRRAEDFGNGMWARVQGCYAAMSFEYYDRDPTHSSFDLDKIEQEIWQQHHIFDFVPGSRFYANFGHLCRYSAAYYTYLWSKVIAQDLFSEFQRQGALNQDVCQQYRETILEPGASKDGTDMVQDFLGRPFSMQPFHKKLQGNSDIDNQ